MNDSRESYQSRQDLLDHLRNQQAAGMDTAIAAVKAAHAQLKQALAALDIVPKLSPLYRQARGTVESVHALLLTVENMRTAAEKTGALPRPNPGRTKRLH